MGGLFDEPRWEALRRRPDWRSDMNVPGPEVQPRSVVPFLERTPAQHAQARGLEPFDLITKHGYSAEQAFGPDPRDAPGLMQQYAEPINKLMLAANFLGPKVTPYRAPKPTPLPEIRYPNYPHAEPPQNNIYYRGVKRPQDLTDLNSVGFNEVHGLFTSPSKREAASYAGDKGWIGTLEVNAKNPFDMNVNNNRPLHPESARVGDISMLGDKDLTQRLREHGYDAVRYWNDRGGQNSIQWMIPFDETIIRRLAIEQRRDPPPPATPRAKPLFGNPVYHQVSEDK